MKPKMETLIQKAAFFAKEYTAKANVIALTKRTGGSHNGLFRITAPARQRAYSRINTRLGLFILASEIRILREHGRSGAGQAHPIRRLLAGHMLQ